MTSQFLPVKSGLVKTASKNMFAVFADHKQFVPNESQTFGSFWMQKFQTFWMVNSPEILWSAGSCGSNGCHVASLSCCARIGALADRTDWWNDWNWRPNNIASPPKMKSWLLIPSTTFWWKGFEVKIARKIDYADTASEVKCSGAHFWEEVYGEIFIYIRATNKLTNLGQW